MERGPFQMGSWPVREQAPPPLEACEELPSSPRGCCCNWEHSVTSKSFLPLNVHDYLNLLCVFKYRQHFHIIQKSESTQLNPGKTAPSALAPEPELCLREAPGGAGLSRRLPESARGTSTRTK